MNDRKKSRKTTKDGLFVPARQVSMLAASALAVAAVVFLGGYFIGKKHMMEHFVAQVEHDSFADQVYSSMYAMYDDAPASEDQEREWAQEEEAGETADEQADSELVLSDELSLEAYVGQLLSYHVRKYADGFVQKMAKRNIPLEVRTRKSVTANGDAKEWYQVITKPYTNRGELEVVVEQLSREEKIKGAHIIVC